MLKARGASNKLLHAIKHLKSIYSMGMEESERFAISYSIAQMKEIRFELKCEIRGIKLPLRMVIPGGPKTLQQKLIEQSKL